MIVKNYARGTLTQNRILSDVWNIFNFKVLSSTLIYTGVAYQPKLYYLSCLAFICRSAPVTRRPFLLFLFFLAFMLTHDSPSMHTKNYFFFFKNSITPRFGSFSSNKFHDLKRGSIIQKNVFKNRFDRCYEDQHIEII